MESDVNVRKRMMSMTRDELREELLKLNGIGRKVADCIMLFSFNQTDIVPVDVHVHRLTRAHYIPSLPAEPGSMKPAAIE
eukprot:GABW01001885.1.p1 GENE.GABW01001885.1~~GABW01001885.1.p1  ORF type:complete len:80 (-),score=6.52 GABW01001885.1:37-276(-)